MAKIKYLGERVKVTFFDHSKDAKDIKVCVIDGHIIEVKEKSFKVANWNIKSPDEKFVDDNIEGVTIYRGAIIEMEFFKSYKKLKFQEESNE